MKMFNPLKVAFSLLLALGLASSANAAVIYINFTNAASSTGALNSLNNVTGTNALALNDSTDSASGISVQITSAVPGGNSTGATSLAGAAAAAGFTVQSGSTNHFAGENVVVTYNFSGLTPSTVNYTFTAFGSRIATDTRTTKYTLTNGIAPQSLNLETSTAAGGNNSNVVVFNPIQSSAGGILTFSFVEDMTSGTQFSYLNAIRIDTAPVPEPSSLALLGLGSFALFARRKRCQSPPIRL